ncbi:MAG: helix-turn-helix domain-containing protein [Elainellaceae cyanobacterium]
MTALPVDPSCLHDGQAARIVASPDDLRQLFNQVEAEFHQSRAYKKILSWFQHQLKGNEDLVAQLASTLGREAIRLTLRQLVASASPADLEPAVQPASGTEVLPSRTTAPPPLTFRAGPAAAEAGLSEAPQVSQTLRVDGAANPFEYVAPQAQSIRDKSDKEERVDRGAANVRPSFRRPYIGPAGIERTTDLQTIEPAEGPAESPNERDRPSLGSASTLVEAGKLLLWTRQQRGLTLDQLHRMTHVPKYHIQAIESGALDQLPEEIYVRGFVRRLSKALGLDGDSLTQCLPAQAAPGPASNPFHRLESQSSRVYLRPAHLYTSYATLMLGALGSLCWVTWQPLADEFDWPQLNAVDNSASVDSEQFFSGRALRSKLRDFELSKQRARHLNEVDGIAAPELILEQLQIAPLSEVP